MMNRVAVCIPSRSRPQQLYGAIARADNYAECADTGLWVALDEDDPTVPQRLTTKHELIMGEWT